LFIPVSAQAVTQCLIKVSINNCAEYYTLWSISYVVRVIDYARDHREQTYLSKVTNCLTKPVLHPPPLAEITHAQAFGN
jgi:hypothetical protein